MNEDNKKITPVILCGGSGRRLWPLSRSVRPKQFLRLRKTGLTLFQETVKRCIDFEPPIIVTSVLYKGAVEAQLKQIQVQDAVIIAEPVPSNTGPAIAIALHHLQRLNRHDASLLVLPCDHLIDDQAEDFSTLVKGAYEASKDHIVLFGVKPSSALTQYGYIETAPSEGSDESARSDVVPVLSFKEKPNLSLAESYLMADNYYWNSGIFLMKFDVAVRAYREYAPALWYQVQNLDPNALHVDQYKNILKGPFDRLILEYAQNVMMQHTALQWTDIGSWKVFMKHWPKFQIFN